MGGSAPTEGASQASSASRRMSTARTILPSLTRGALEVWMPGAGDSGPHSKHGVFECLLTRPWSSHPEPPTPAQTQWPELVGGASLAAPQASHQPPGKVDRLEGASRVVLWGGQGGRGSAWCVGGGDFVFSWQ